MQVNDSRDLSVDFFKGIAMLCVISIHSIGYLPFVQCSGRDLPLFFVRQLTVIGVPLFVFWAGYFASTRVAKRMIRLGVPYLIWTFIWVAIYNSDRLLRPISFVCVDLGLGFGTQIGYYVVALIQLTILTPVLLKGVQRFPARTILLAVLLNASTILLYYLFGNGIISCGRIPVPTPCPSILFSMWILPYVLGLWCRVHHTDSGKRVVPFAYRKMIFVATSVALILEVFEGVSWSAGSVAVSQFRLTSFLFSILVCMACYCIHLRVSSINLLCVLGRGSFIVYLTHMLVLNYLTCIRPGPATDGWLNVVKWITSLALVAGGYYVIIITAEKFIPKRVRCWVGIS